MNSIEKIYLGDSVYIARDRIVPRMFVLTTENRVTDDPTNTIYLEEEIIANLLEYLRERGFPRSSTPSGSPAPCDR